MHFKKVEMVGFKSFVDPTDFRFQPGITAVVGPNGSGKSNIVDGIRWVLGEQSAKSLRGADMQDVIFNGTERRPPYGMAEVSLTILNDDKKLKVEFHEVTVTRRLYRSGESEYLLNNSPCRLRDIEDLFVDTGIGTSAYSVLEQGKISAILSAKPEARRDVFEEAAGVMKFRLRRDESRRRLAATEQNLVRVADIIGEIKHQIGSMERHARKAERYKLLKAELDSLELTLLSDEWGTTVAAHREGEAKRLEALGSRAKADDAHRTAATALSEAKDTLLSAEEEVSRRMGEQRSLDSEVQALESLLAVNRERRASTQADHERFLEDERRLRARHTERAAALASAKRDADESEAAFRTAASASASVQALLEHAQRQAQEAQDRLSRAHASRLEAVRRATELTTRIEALSRRALDEETQGSRLTSGRDGAQRDFEAATDESRANEDGRTAVVERRQGARRSRDEAEAAAKSAAAAAERLAAELSTARGELEGRRERLRTLEELAASLEGYAGGVKTIVQAARAEPGAWRGVHGVLAHLLRTEAKHEAAIEAGLGAAVQDILVDNAATAERGIAHLSAHAAGRATFVPLDGLRAEDASARARALANEPGVVGCALDLVRFDDRHRPAAVRYLSGVVVVETFDAVLGLARSRRLDIVLVALTGEVVYPNGAMAGGPVSKGGLIAREREIRDLKDEVPRRERETSSLEAAHASASGERTRAEAALSLAEATEADLRRADEDLRRDAERLLGQLRSRESRLREAVEALRIWTEKAAETSRERTEVQAAHGQCASDEEASRAEAVAADGALGAARLAAQALQGEAEAARLHSAALESSHSARTADANRIQIEIVELTAGISTARDAAEAAGRRAADLEAERSARESELASRGAARAEGERALAGVQADRSASSRDVAACEATAGSTREALDRATEALHRLEVEQTEAGAALRRIEEKLRDSFGRTPADVAEVPGGFDRGTTTGRALELRTKIDEMGPVSVAAMEEFENARKRHDDLVAQTSDLETARGHLTELLDRINAESRDRFLETFRAVQLHFRDIFRELFGGGDAEVKLADENDPLECGIEVYARPPGKKLQSLSLLSGGEQSKTAIGLLFALLRHKPAPFCVLDEMDAALDDANIVRFCRLLGSFATTTQFIIITHSRITMEMADVLYGVTMEEPGVSKIVSVKLKEPVEA